MTRATGPLVGIRVVEFDAIGPVPLAGMLFADIGADVIRIARPRNEHDGWEDVGGATLHRSRCVVELNLKNPTDLEKALALIARADALIEGHRPGVMERRHNPRRASPALLRYALRHNGTSDIDTRSASGRWAADA